MKIFKIAVLRKQETSLEVKTAAPDYIALNKLLDDDESSPSESNKNKRKIPTVKRYVTGPRGDHVKSPGQPKKRIQDDRQYNAPHIPQADFPLEEQHLEKATRLLREQLRLGKPDPALENFVRMPFAFDKTNVTITFHARQRYYQRARLKAKTYQEIQDTNAQAIRALQHGVGVWQGTGDAVKTIVQNSKPVTIKTSLLVHMIILNIKKDPVMYVSDGTWVVPIYKKGNTQEAASVLSVEGFSQDELERDATFNLKQWLNKQSQFEEEDDDQFGDTQFDPELEKELVNKYDKIHREVELETEQQERESKREKSITLVVKTLNNLCSCANIELDWIEVKEYAKKEIIKAGGMEPHQCKHLAGKMFIDAIMGKPFGNESLGGVTPDKMRFIVELTEQDILKNEKDLRLADAIFNRTVSDDMIIPAFRYEATYKAWAEYKKARKAGIDALSWMRTR